MNVLLVEDNEGDIEMTKIAFKKSGVASQLIVTHDGQEAVDYLYKRAGFTDAVTPDLVLVDLNMPRMDGKEFLDVVKNDDALKAIPVIMLTSSQAPAEIRECYRRHANSYILKPSGLDKFIDLARQIHNYWQDLARLPAVALI